MNKTAHIVNHALTIRDVLKKMDTENIDFVVAVNNTNKVTGVFTSGDFSRAVLNGVDIQQKISEILNKNFLYLKQGFLKQTARSLFNKNNLVMCIPIVNKKFELVKIVERKDIFSNLELKKKTIFKNFPVIIIAGGKGTRLKPFTNVLPKPLIPYKNDTILKSVLNKFLQFSFNNFYVSLNEKANIIKAYLDEFKSEFNIKFIEEKKPLGTAGPLGLLKKKLTSTFFVANCDILINSHYPSMIEFHKSNNFDLTIISSLKNYSIPYGVCELDKTGRLKNIREKPELNFLVNTGLYLMEPKILKLIPANRDFNMIELINKAKKKKMKIGSFPVSENSWIDVGEWNEYFKNNKP